MIAAMFAMLKIFKPPDGTPRNSAIRAAPCRRAWGSGTFVLCSTMIAKLGATPGFSLNFSNRDLPSITSKPRAAVAWVGSGKVLQLPAVVLAPSCFLAPERCGGRLPPLGASLRNAVHRNAVYLGISPDAERRSFDEAHQRQRRRDAAQTDGRPVTDELEHFTNRSAATEQLQLDYKRMKSVRAPVCETLFEIAGRRNFVCEFLAHFDQLLMIGASGARLWRSR